MHDMCHDVSQNPPGRYAIDSYSVWDEFDCNRLRKRDDSSFGSGISRMIRFSPLSSRAREINNTAKLPCFHLWNYQIAHVECACEIYRDSPAPMSGRHRSNLPFFPNTGTIDEYIDSTELL